MSNVTLTINGVPVEGITEVRFDPQTPAEHFGVYEAALATAERSSHRLLLRSDAPELPRGSYAAGAAHLYMLRRQSLERWRRFQEAHAQPDPGAPELDLPTGRPFKGRAGEACRRRRNHRLLESMRPARMEGR